MSWLYWFRFLFVAGLVTVVVLIVLMSRGGGQLRQRNSPRSESKKL